MIFPSSPVLLLITARSSRRRYAPSRPRDDLGAHLPEPPRAVSARRWMAAAAAWISATTRRLTILSPKQLRFEQLRHRASKRASSGPPPTPPPPVSAAPSPGGAPARARVGPERLVDGGGDASRIGGTSPSMSPSMSPRRAGGGGREARRASPPRASARSDASAALASSKQRSSGEARRGAVVVRLRRGVLFRLENRLELARVFGALAFARCRSLALEAAVPGVGRGTFPARRNAGGLRVARRVRAQSLRASASSSSTKPSPCEGGTRARASRTRARRHLRPT